MTRCEAITKKKVRCPNNGEYSASGKKILCHIHDMDGKFQQQLMAKHDKGCPAWAAWDISDACTCRRQFLPRFNR